jgi:hypothetical protein
MAVGFSKEPKEIDEVWTKEHRGRTYTFTVTKYGPHRFDYGCQCALDYEKARADNWVGFTSDHRLTRDEVERRPQFLEFMNGASR